MGMFLREALSQMLAYYTHKKLFDRLQVYAQSRSIKMTCYVDDLVFSGKKIVIADRVAICSLIRKAGLKPNTKKTRLYRPNQAKKSRELFFLTEKREFQIHFEETSMISFAY